MACAIKYIILKRGVIMGAKVGTYGRKTSSSAKKFTGISDFGKLGSRPSRTPKYPGSLGKGKQSRK